MFFSYANFQGNIHGSIIVMKSIDTRFFRNVFEAVDNTRSTCFIGSKTTTEAAPRGF